MSPDFSSCSCGWTRKRIIIMKWGECWENKVYTMWWKADHVGKKVYCVAQRRQKWNNKLDSSTQHNYAKQMWRPKQLNNLCNTSGAAQPISLLYSAFPSFKELIAEHFSFFSAQPKPSLALHLFLVYRCNVSGWLESITYRCWFLVSYFTVALLKHWRRFHLFCNNYLSFFAFLRIVE